MKAPFPWFGGKRRIAAEVWARLGKPRQYIEPFCGSAAVLLAAPAPASLEVIGDQNFYVANFWRVLSYQPEDLIRWQTYPVSHVDQYARHRWLQDPTRTGALVANLIDPEWPGDAQMAGWWVWGQCSWIGSGWCEPGKVPHTSNAGVGSQALGKVPHTGDAGMELAGGWLRALAQRMLRVRVIHGSWDRTLNHHYGKSDTAVFLDPPYKGTAHLYGCTDIADDVAKWALENQSLRIVLCGHAGDYDLPGWAQVSWSRAGLTYGGGTRKDDEILWCSPACHSAAQQTLWGTNP